MARRKNSIDICHRFDINQSKIIADMWEPLKIHEIWSLYDVIVIMWSVQQFSESHPHILFRMWARIFTYEHDLYGRKIVHQYPACILYFTYNTYLWIAALIHILRNCMSAINNWLQYHRSASENQTKKCKVWWEALTISRKNKSFLLKFVDFSVYLF